MHKNAPNHLDLARFFGSILFHAFLTGREAAAHGIGQRGFNISSAIAVAVKMIALAGRRDVDVFAVEPVGDGGGL